jgi:serine/threonine protein kinase
MAEPSTRFDPPLPGARTVRYDVQADTRPTGLPEDEGESLDVPLHAGMKPLPDYELVSLLGRGGYGEVWKAHGPGGFDVALKFIRFGTAVPVEERALELMRSVKHPHLLPIFGAWRKDKFLIIAMELGAGTLMQRLQESKNKGEDGIPFDVLKEFLGDAAKAIDYLNERGIQHRDVKPQNLLLVGGGVKVADFGLAKFLEQSVASNSGALTPGYAAPEFFNGHTSQQSDQYSLAITYCQLRGGRLPFHGNPAQLMAGHLMQPPDLTMLPPAERPAVARALAKKPEERWPNCRTFADELLRGTTAPSRNEMAKQSPVPSGYPPIPTEPARVKCPHCTKVLRVKPEKWHKRLKCPNCQQAFLASNAELVSPVGIAAGPGLSVETPLSAVPQPTPMAGSGQHYAFRDHRATPPPLPLHPHDQPPPLPFSDEERYRRSLEELTEVPPPSAMPSLSPRPRPTATPPIPSRSWGWGMWLLLGLVLLAAIGIGIAVWYTQKT